MNSDLNFRIGFAVIAIPIFAIRYYYLGRIARSGDRVAVRAGRLTTGLVGVVSVMATLVPAVYVLTPRWLDWAALSLPASLRWAAVGLGLISVPLLYWVHRTLGDNFNLPGVIPARQALTTEGPYGWVRHPMYTAFALFGLAGFLISANGLVGLALLGYWLAALALVGKEEETLIETFGESYRLYMQRAGRFLPR